MNPKVESVMKSLRRILLLALLALGIGAVFILLIHENPLEAYAALFKGAFVGKLKIENWYNSGQLYPAAFDVHCICSGG